MRFASLIGLAAILAACQTTPIERDSLDWSWQRSDDDGETWTSLWEIEYSRVL